MHFQLPAVLYYALSMKKQIRGFIFDIDGTLIDSNDAHAECLRKAFRHEGFAIEFDTIRKLIGMGFDHIMPKLTGLSAESEEGKTVSRLKDTYFQEVFPSIPVFPDAKKLVKTLYENDYKIGIATSASRNDLKKFTQKIGIEPYLDEKMSADDADASKPCPDIIEAALDKMGLKPEEAVMVGDTPYDIKAAARAQVKTIAFRTGEWPEEELKGAVAVVNGPAELLKNFPKVLAQITANSGQPRI